jgi:hypothetical protein
MNRTVLILEPHLEGSFGHPWRYAIALTRRFAQLGWTTRILAHATYRGPAQIEGADVVPVFARSYYEQQDRITVRARHRSTETSTLSPFALTVLNAIETQAGHCEELRVVAPTATVAILAELLALPLFLADPPRIALMFHEQPELYASWYRPLDLTALRWRLRGSGWIDRIRCFATNRRLAQRLAELLDTPVDNIGDVFDDTEIARLTASHDQGTPVRLAPDEQQLFDELTGFRRNGGRLAWCPGRMRPDKGAARLATIVDAIARTQPRYRLLLQRPDAGDGALPVVDAVAQHPDALVYSGTLSDNAYGVLLRLADVILLPYDPDVYGWRVSRVFLETALAGKPVLAAAGMAAEAEQPHPAATFLADWRSWPDHANALTARASARDDGATARAVTQWHRLPAWLVRATPATVPSHKAVLHVSSFDTCGDPRAADERRIEHLAMRGFAVVELLIPRHPFDRRAIAGAIRSRRACSPAQLTAWPLPPHRLVRRLRRLLAMIPLLRHAVARWDRLAPGMPAVIEMICARRRFAFVLIDDVGHKQIVESLATRAPLWLMSSATQGAQTEADETACAADMDAAIARLVSGSDQLQPQRPASAAPPALTNVR